MLYQHGCAVPPASVFSVAQQLRQPACTCHRSGTAKGGGGDFACGKCTGTSADGRQRYSSKAGATSCSLCPDGGRVDAARTACITYPPGTQPGPGNTRRPCPAGALPAPPHHINKILICMMFHAGAARLLFRMNEQAAIITTCMRWRRNSQICRAALQQSSQLVSRGDLVLALPELPRDSEGRRW
jgi:hypothetical protein